MTSSKNRYECRLLNSTILSSILYKGFRAILIYMKQPDSDNQFFGQALTQPKIKLNILIEIIYFI